MEQSKDLEMSQDKQVPLQPSRHGSSKRKRSQNGHSQSAYLSTSSKRNRLSKVTSNDMHQEDTKRASNNDTKRRFNNDTKQTSNNDTSQRGNKDSKQTSKFKEGSMNDKPSAIPPTLFTRDVSDHSTASSANLDRLMDDYNGGHMRQSVDMHQSHHPTKSALRDTDPPPNGDTSSCSTETGLFRFGRMVASSFNPLNVWSNFSRSFKDTRDDLTIRNIQENRRKAQQKADAEAKYAEMKAAGHFDPSPFPAMPAPQPAHSVLKHQHSDSAAPQSAQQSLKSHRSMFGIRRPSLSSLRNPPSDHILSDLSQPSQPPISASPTKKNQAARNPLSTLRNSLSSQDFRRQQRLSKRVTDLETKLADARFELTTAINNASPLPNLPSPFEKYNPGKHMTPNPRVKPRFIPGQLPSLPSERLLFPEMNQNVNQGMHVLLDTQSHSQPHSHSHSQPHSQPHSHSHSQPHSHSHSQPHSHSHSQPQSHSHSQPHSQLTHMFTPPTRNSHHQLLPDSIIATTESPLTGITRAMPKLLSHFSPEKPLPALPDLQVNDEHVHVGHDLDMDQQTSRAPSQSGGNYQDLGATLKPLDKAVSSKNRKKTASKKRKSTDDKEYKPGNDTDDEDIEKPKNSKKQKSAGQSSVQDTSPLRVPRRKSSKHATTKTAGTKYIESSDLVVRSSDGALDVDLAVVDSSHLSMDSQAALEPIFEEEQVSAKHDSGVSMAATQEKTLRTAACGSPPPSNYSAMEDVIDGIVSVTPGKGSAPKMPALGRSSNTVTLKHSISKIAHKSVETSHAVSENFEWPDDVF